MATLVFFNKWMEAQFDFGISNTAIDFDGDTIKLALVNSSYTPAVTTDTVWANASPNEVSGDGYTAGGETVTFTVTETGGVVTVAAANVMWSENSGGFSDARYGVVYKATAHSANSPLVGYINLTSDRGNVSNDLAVNFSANGMFRVQSA